MKTSANVIKKNEGFLAISDMETRRHVVSPTSFMPEPIETCYVIGPSKGLQLVLKYLREQSLLLEQDKHITDISKLKEICVLATNVFGSIHFVQHNRENAAMDLKKTTHCEVVQWLSEMFSIEKEASKVNALEMSEDPEEKMMPLYKPKLPPVSDKAQKFLAFINEHSFDIFALEAALPEQSFRHVVRKLMTSHNFLSIFKIPMMNLENFISAAEIGYRLHHNTYHNEIHAADVAQTLNSIILQSGYINYLSSLELLTCLFAAIIHDYEHTGTTNTFHIKTCSELALLYNDRAILENFHVSRIFRKMKEDTNTNIFVNLSHEQFMELRCNSIDLVLATDMNFHFTMIKNLSDINSLTSIQLLGGLTHFSDISHPLKDFSIHNKWVDRLFQEFFKQGDLEKKFGLSTSPLCDRSTTMLPESQIGFIDLIMAPALDALFDALPVHTATKVKTTEASLEIEQGMSGISKLRSIYKNNLSTNRLIWSKKARQEDECKL